MLKGFIKNSAVTILLSMSLSAQAAPAWTKACWDFLTGKSNSSASAPDSTLQGFKIKLSVTFEREIRHNFDSIVRIEDVNASLRALLSTNEAFNGITKKDFKFEVILHKEPKFTEHFYVIKPPATLTPEQLLLLQDHLSQFNAQGMY